MIETMVESDQLISGLKMNSKEQNQQLLHVRLLAGLKKYGPVNDELVVSDNETVIDVLNRLGIQQDLVRAAFVDGRFVELEQPLNGAQKLLLLPAIGGG